MMKKTENRSLWRRVLIALVATIVIVWFYPHPEADHYNYEEGRPWNYAQLIAPFDIPVHPDSQTVRNILDTLRNHFVPVYQVHQLTIDSVIRNLPPSPGRDYHGRLANMLRRYYASGVVSSETMRQIQADSLPSIRILEKNELTKISTSQFMSPRQVFQRIDTAITDVDFRHYMVSANLPDLLAPNYVFDENESRRHFDYEYLRRTADRGVILQGQTIINKGEIVTPQAFTNLRTYEQLLAQRNQDETSNDLLGWVGQFAFVSLLMATLMLYFYFFVPAIYNRDQALIFMFSLVTVFFLLAALLNSVFSHGIYLVPMTIVPILVLVFFDGRTALFVSTVLALICAGITAFALEFLFLQFCAAGAAVYSLRELSRRSQLLRTSGLVLVAYLAGYVALELLMNGSTRGFTGKMFVFLCVNSVFTSMAYVLMFAVERVFGFVSVVTMVELADINAPLLQRLSDECPGTFQHSIAVSNLASDATQRIGGNVQLVRAGALYHDIGKLTNPAFFTENQHGVNPHDALPPERSAQIVTAHVADGLRLADKAGLPGMIKDFIRQHHGAGMAKYFYYTYAKAHPGEEVDTAPFSYPGPNPQSRETSVMMMADAVEAASRSLTEHSREAITDLVNKIIDGQIADGLHDQSPLAFRDVAIIKEAFIKRLMTIYHSRIAYPGK